MLMSVQVGRSWTFGFEGCVEDDEGGALLRGQNTEYASAIEPSLDNGIKLHFGYD